MSERKQAPLVRQIRKYKTVQDAARDLGHRGVGLTEALTTIMFLADQVEGLEIQVERLSEAKSYTKLEESERAVAALNARGTITGRHSCSGRPAPTPVVWPRPINWRAPTRGVDQHGRECVEF